MTEHVRDFYEQIEQTRKETVWKIEDVQKIIQSRISSHEVTSMVKDLKSQLSFNLQMVDERINSQLIKDVEELKSKIQFNLENTDTKHEEIRFEVKSF